MQPSTAPVAQGPSMQELCDFSLHASESRQSALYHEPVEPPKPLYRRQDHLRLDTNVQGGSSVISPSPSSNVRAIFKDANSGSPSSRLPDVTQYRNSSSITKKYRRSNRASVGSLAAQNPQLGIGHSHAASLQLKSRSKAENESALGGVPSESSLFIQPLDSERLPSPPAKASLQPGTTPLGSLYPSSYFDPSQPIAQDARSSGYASSYDQGQQPSSAYPSQEYPQRQYYLDQPVPPRQAELWESSHYPSEDLYSGQQQQQQQQGQEQEQQQHRQLQQEESSQQANPYSWKPFHPDLPEHPSVPTVPGANPSQEEQPQANLYNVAGNSLTTQEPGWYTHMEPAFQQYDQSRPSQPQYPYQYQHVANLGLPMRHTSPQREKYEYPHYALTLPAHPPTVPALASNNILPTQSSDPQRTALSHLVPHHVKPRETNTLLETQIHRPTMYLQARPYACEQCSQAFSRNHDLKRHKRIHLAIKPFPCDTCEKTFSRKDALKRHQLMKRCGAGRRTRGKNAAATATATTASARATAMQDHYDDPGHGPRNGDKVEEYQRQIGTNTDEEDARSRFTLHPLGGTGAIPTSMYGGQEQKSPADWYAPPQTQTQQHDTHNGNPYTYEQLQQQQQQQQGQKLGNMNHVGGLETLVPSGSIHEAPTPQSIHPLSSIPLYGHTGLEQLGLPSAYPRPSMLTNPSPYDNSNDSNNKWQDPLLPQAADVRVGDVGETKQQLAMGMSSVPMSYDEGPYHASPLNENPQGGPSYLPGSLVQGSYPRSQAQTGNHEGLQ